MQNSKGVGFFLRIGASLLLIAAVVAGMLAAVNLITKDRIARNQQEELNASIGEIFGGAVEKSDIDGDFGEGVRSVYQVRYDGGNAGYCVYVETPGYGGTIGMMVGFTPEGSVLGISIVEISETAGLGSRVDDEGYLSQYRGAQEQKTLSGIDVITGSTVSSRAVMNGVNLAIQTYAVIGGESDE